LVESRSTNMQTGIYAEHWAGSLRYAMSDESLIRTDQ